MLPYVDFLLTSAETPGWTCGTYDMLPGVDSALLLSSKGSPMIPGLWVGALGGSTARVLDG